MSAGDDGFVEEGDAKPITGDMDMIAADVGEGYTATLGLFEKAVEADDDVAAKQKVLNGYLEDDTADVEQTTLITNARSELAKSQTKPRPRRTPHCTPRPVPTVTVQSTGPVSPNGVPRARWRRQ